MSLTAGARLRSQVCDGEFVVVKAPAGDVALRCGGQPLVAPAEAPPVLLPAAPELSEGCQLGKRYEHAESGLELLCAKQSTGTLTVSDEVLAQRGAKPLPASD